MRFNIPGSTFRELDSRYALEEKIPLLQSLPDALSSPFAPFKAFICTDINPHAAICTSRTGAANSVSSEKGFRLVFQLAFVNTQSERFSKIFVP